jgi:lipoate-protein ligase A
MNMPKTVKTDFKVPGGKLLRVQLALDGQNVATVKITGDFFIHPEEALPLIEKALQGSSLDWLDMEERIQKTVMDGRIQLIGFTPSDLANAILQATGKKREVK